MEDYVINSENLHNSDWTSHDTSFLRVLTTTTDLQFTLEIIAVNYVNHNFQETDANLQRVL